MTENKKLSQEALNALTGAAVEQYRILGLEGGAAAGSMWEGLAGLVDAGAADEAALAAFEAAVAAERRDTEMNAPLPKGACTPPGEAVQRELIAALLQACTGEQQWARPAVEYLKDFWDLPELPAEGNLAASENNAL